MSPISSKTTVAQCDLGPISRNRKVVHGVFHKLWLPNNTGQFEAKRRLRRVFWRQFQATGKMRTVFSSCFTFQAKRQLCRVFWRQFQATKVLRTEFLTTFSFLTIRANLKQNNSCAVWFEANLEIQESCARRFSQALAFQQYGLIWSKTTVSQSVLTPISSSRTIAHGVFDKS